MTLPLYNGDLENDGRPEIVETLASKVKSADRVIMLVQSKIKRPSAALKNAFYWMSRVRDGCGAY